MPIKRRSGDDIAREVINHFWMGHAPETISVMYSRLDWNSAFVLLKRSQWASVHRSACSNCSKLLHNSGRIGGRIGFATFVESNE